MRFFPLPRVIEGHALLERSPAFCVFDQVDKNKNLPTLPILLSTPSFEVLHFFTFNTKEAAMYARLTFIDIDPKDLKQVSEIYNTQIAPQIRECKGIKDVMLLEPTDSSGQTISITMWKSKEDADEYENSGTYRRMVDMVKDKFVGKPVLKVYRVQESGVAVM